MPVIKASNFSTFWDIPKTLEQFSSDGLSNTASNMQKFQQDASLVG